MADIPGLVEGAAEGKGLRHRLTCATLNGAQVLVVLLDLDPMAEHTPPEQLRILMGELGSYQPDLPEGVPAWWLVPRPTSPRRAQPRRGGCELILSAATNRGVRPRAGRATGGDGRPSFVGHFAAAADTGDVVIHRPVPEGVDVRKVEAGVWQVVGRAAERAVAFSDLTDDGALAEAVRRLKRLGVDRALARAGARDGDEVTVGAMTFTWGGENDGGLGPHGCRQGRLVLGDRGHSGSSRSRDRRRPRERAHRRRRHVGGHLRRVERAGAGRAPTQ